MTSITLVLDESGAKGFADQREQHEGELGVTAGFLIPTNLVPRVTSEIEEIISKFQVNGKFHITDLSASDQSSLRNEVFDYMNSVKAYWVYKAIYVEGYYSNYQNDKNIKESFRQEQNSKIKFSKNERKERLHTQLLFGAFTKAAAFCRDNITQKEFTLNIVTDQIDAPIIEEFKVAIQNFLSIGKKKEHTLKGFDTSTQKIVQSHMTTEITFGKEFFDDFSNISFEITVSDSPLTIVSDILANSAHYYLSSFQKNNLGGELNAIDAIDQHPLAHLVYGVSSNDIHDVLYSHPNNKTKNST